MKNAIFYYGIVCLISFFSSVLFPSWLSYIVVGLLFIVPLLKIRSLGTYELPVSVYVGVLMLLMWHGTGVFFGSYSRILSLVFLIIGYIFSIVIIVIFYFFIQGRREVDVTVEMLREVEPLTMEEKIQTRKEQLKVIQNFIHRFVYHRKEGKGYRLSLQYAYTESLVESQKLDEKNPALEFYIFKQVRLKRHERDN